MKGIPVSQKTEIAAGASYVAATSGIAIGSWLAEHWLQALSALFMVLTFLTQLIFSIRKDRREHLRALREEELHNREAPPSDC